MRSLSRRCGCASHGENGSKSRPVGGWMRPRQRKKAGGKTRSRLNGQPHLARRERGLVGWHDLPGRARKSARRLLRHESAEGGERITLKFTFHGLSVAV